MLYDDFVLVTDNEQLNRLCAEWMKKEFIALDTEFIRTSTFFPKAGLIQLNADDTNYLIDPLALSDWESFKALMQSAAVIKVFHSCSEDIQVFMAHWQLLPRPVFDTQIAAAILNEGFGCSYQALVNDKIHLELPKGETRSDWLKRPLDQKQLHYAALDVAYLPQIFAMQSQALLEKNRLGWLTEDCKQLLDSYAVELESNFEDFYRTFRGAWQLDRRQLAVLKKLAEWRELRARKRDKPRNWIVRDKTLIDIAITQPVEVDALKTIDEIGKTFIRYEGSEVVALVREALTLPEEELPALLPRPLTARQKNQLKKAQQFVEQKALELDLPVEMLARKRWIMALLQNLIDAGYAQGAAPSELDAALLPPELSGWRRPLLFPQLMEVMR